MSFNYEAMRSTSLVCRCGRIDYPHACSIEHPDGPIPAVAVEVQGRIVYDVSPWLDPSPDDSA